jgi:hypothetical protein
MNFIDDSLAYKAGNRQAADLVGRHLGSKFATVSSNNDPLNNRRIRVKYDHTPDVESDWILRATIAPGIDPPVPRVGQRVIISYHDANPHLATYTGVINNSVTNLPFASTNPLIDHIEFAAGDIYSFVPANRFIALFVGNASFILSNPNNDSVGAISFGGAVITVNNGTLNITGVNNITLNGVAVAKVGGIDSRGDITQS